MNTYQEKWRAIDNLSRNLRERSERLMSKYEMLVAVNEPSTHQTFLNDYAEVKAWIQLYIKTIDDCMPQEDLTKVNVKSTMKLLELSTTHNSQDQQG